jgi:hypothetical protein
VGFFAYLMVASALGKRENLPLNEWLGKTHARGGKIPGGGALEGVNKPQNKV